MPLARRFASLGLPLLGLVGACGDDGGASASATGAGASGAGGAGGAGATTAAPSTAIAPTATGAGGLPEVIDVEGVVVDPEGAPIEGASVLQGGGEVELVTGPDGTFAIAIATTVPGAPTLVAAKLGHRSAGLELDALTDGPITLVLVPIAAPDNALGYTFGDPGTGDPTIDTSTEVCGHCHSTFAREFGESAHAKSARDPLVQDLYAGVASALTTEAACLAAGGVWRAGTKPGTPSQSLPKCYVGHGALPDLNACGGPGELACDDPARPASERPTRFGACADCHAIGMDGPAGGRDLLEAEGLAFARGNHCDACHHVREVDLAAPPGTGGRLVMQRPREKQGGAIDGPILQALFGPYLDVPNTFMGGSPQPQYREAVFCAGCHEQLQPALLLGESLDPARWPEGLPVHSTYSEWLASPWADANAPCQNCHMPALEGLTNAMDVATPDDAGIAFGFPRAPSEVRSHSFRGPLTDPGPGVPRLLDGVVQVGLAPAIVAESGGLVLEVASELVNVSAGHAVPTGEPLRSLVLVVEAEACGVPLVATRGPALDALGGAIASGLVGQGASVAGASVAWPAGAAAASVGDVVRISRFSGEFIDYDGVAPFAGDALSPAEKGLPLELPAGARTVLAVNGDTLLLDGDLAALPGDRVWLGTPLPAAFADGDASRPLAGAPGRAFARVLVDAQGERGVPHHRAVDLTRDDRLMPLVPAELVHAFALPQPLPSGCLEASVRATLLYRPLPLHLARERAWDARDYVVMRATETIALP